MAGLLTPLQGMTWSGQNFRKETVAEVDRQGRGRQLRFFFIWKRVLILRLNHVRLGVL